MPTAEDTTASAEDTTAGADDGRPPAAGRDGTAAEDTEPQCRWTRRRSADGRTDKRKSGLRP